MRPAQKDVYQIRCDGALVRYGDENPLSHSRVKFIAVFVPQDVYFGLGVGLRSWDIVLKKRAKRGAAIMVDKNIAGDAYFVAGFSHADHII